MVLKRGDNILNKVIKCTLDGIVFFLGVWILAYLIFLSLTDHKIRITPLQKNTNYPFKLSLINHTWYTTACRVFHIKLSHWAQLIINTRELFLFFSSDFIFIKCFPCFSFFLLPPSLIFLLLFFEEEVDAGEPDLQVWLHPALLIKATQVGVKGFLTAVGFSRLVSLSIAVICGNSECVHKKNNNKNGLFFLSSLRPAQPI